jgi:hypothetical protein
MKIKNLGNKIGWAIMIACIISGLSLLVLICLMISCINLTMSVYPFALYTQYAGINLIVFAIMSFLAGCVNYFKVA